MWNHSKGHFQDQKGPIWTFVIYLAKISETVHTMINVSMKHLYKVIYNISFYIKTFDLR